METHFVVLGILSMLCYVVLAGPITAKDEDLEVSGDPYADILSDPNFRPKAEVATNKTIDQLIRDNYKSYSEFMSESFLSPDGDITAELDMVLKREQYESLYENKESGNGGRQKRKATRPVAYRWTDKTIPYEFITSHFTADEVFMIKGAMAKWEETTCLKFKPATGADRNRIRFRNGYGCNSMLGMVGGTQDINLEKPGCRFSGLYLHEVGHAIGLVHEHQLPDRDNYIYILYDNVAPSMRQWFNKYSADEVNQYGVPFEYSSVMHYGITAFSKDGYSQTIRAKDASKEWEIGRVYLKGLSFTDIKVVNIMYNCNEHCAKDATCQEPAYLDKNCKCVKPDPPTKEQCKNLHSDSECEDWAARGECEANPTWMKDNCRKACKVCSDTGTGTVSPVTVRPGLCTNAHGNDAECEGWARDGECNKNPQWMKGNCRKACGVCDGDVTQKPGGCGNEWGDAQCEGWAQDGECEKNPIWMKQNCKKACNVCDGDGTVTSNPGGCSNTWGDSKCNGWAETGECEANSEWMRTNCKKACNACNGGVTDKPGSCVNTWGDFQCDGWAESGECEANAIWMKQHCTKACKACPTDCVQCEDMHQSCSAWTKSGYCESNWYTKENCKKSCGTCDTSATECKPPNDNPEQSGESGSMSTSTRTVIIVVVVLAAVAVLAVVAVVLLKKYKPWKGSTEGRTRFV